MNFLPISILAYGLNGGAILIDKILIKHSLPNPFVYTFYINLLAMVTIFLIPLGINLNSTLLIFGILSGIAGNLALLTLFQSLKLGEASIVGPMVGFLNPVFTLILGVLFLNQTISQTQFSSFLILLLGASLLTFSIWSKGLKLNQQLLMMILSGFFFALSYLFLKEAFLVSNFLSGLVVSRLAGGIFALSFIVLPSVRSQVFSSKLSQNNFINKVSLLLLLGQSMGAIQGLLLTYAVSLAHPALVNSLFGIQYLVILVVSLTLAKKHPHLLDEKLTLPVIGQKIVGVLILSYGLYMLSQ